MKKILFIINLLLAGAIIAHAKIGETRSELIARFGSRQLISQSENLMWFRGKNEVHIVLRNGRSVVESYWMYTTFSTQDANEILRIVLGALPELRRISTGVFITAGGLYQIVTFPPQTAGAKWGITIGITADVQARLDDAKGFFDESVTPTKPAPTPEKRDCAVVAAELYDRLKKIATWCEVIGLHYVWQDQYGKTQDVGHAVVAYQYDPNGSVFITDASGTFELAIKFNDLESIRGAWQLKTPLLKLDQMRVLAGPTSKATPTPEPTAEPDATPDRGLQPSLDTPEIVVTPTPEPKATAAEAVTAIKIDNRTLGLLIFVLLLILAITTTRRVTS